MTVPIHQITPQIKRTVEEIDIQPGEFTEERNDSSLQDGNGMNVINIGVKGVKGKKERKLQTVYKTTN